MERALELARKGRGLVFAEPAGRCRRRQGWRRSWRRFSREGRAAPTQRLKHFAQLESLATTQPCSFTLEPCNHHGRTPPCVDAILAAGIREVIVGTDDPNPNVGGGGIQRLRAEGVAVETGVCEDAARELIRMFAWHSRSGRPYVVAKFGASVDGKIATHTGESKWINR